jgi:hypothetical protein
MKRFFSTDVWENVALAAIAALWIAATLAIGVDDGAWPIRSASDVLTWIGAAVKALFGTAVIAAIVFHAGRLALRTVQFFANLLLSPSRITRETWAAAKLSFLFAVWIVVAYGFSLVMGFPNSVRWAEYPSQYVGGALGTVLCCWWAIRRLQRVRLSTGDVDETLLAIQWFVSFIAYFAAAGLVPISKEWGFQSGWLDAAALVVAVAGCIGTTVVIALAMSVEPKRERRR